MNGRSTDAPSHNQGYASVTCSRRLEGTVATVTVCNPTSLNSLNTAVLISFCKVVSSLAVMHDLRCVIVTGGPCNNGRRAFIGGADIHEMSGLASPEAGRAFIHRVHLACKALRDLPVPVIARVNGHALGAGLLIMIAADVRIVQSDALLGMPEVRRGVPSTVESALLPGIIGVARARRLLIFGEELTAATAREWGLIDEIVQPEQSNSGELDRHVEKYVQYALQAGPQAAEAQKRLFSTWEQVPTSEGIKAGIWEFGKAFEEGAEGRQMMRTFLRAKRDRKSKI